MMCRSNRLQAGPTALEMEANLPCFNRQKAGLHTSAAKGSRVSQDNSTQTKAGHKADSVGLRGLELAILKCQLGSGEVARVLMETDLCPGLRGFTRIISNLGKLGEAKRALEVYGALELVDLKPDAKVVNAAISACDKGGPWQTALQLYHSMGSLGLQRDIVTYCAIISVISWSKQWETAVELYQEMQCSGVSADAWLCSSLLRALERGGQWRMAHAFFLRMCTATGLPTQHLAEASEEHPSERDSPQQVGGVWPSIKHVSSISSEDDVSCGIASPCGSPSKAGRAGAPTLEEVAALAPAVKPNTICCNVLLQAYACARPTQWELAIALLEDMQGWADCSAARTAPDMISYNVVIKACSQARQLPAALHVYDAMLRRGVGPTIQVLTMMMGAAAEDPSPHGVSEVLARFEASGLPTSSAFSATHRTAMNKQARTRGKPQSSQTSPMTPPSTSSSLPCSTARLLRAASFPSSPSAAAASPRAPSPPHVAKAAVGPVPQLSGTTAHKRALRMLVAATTNNTPQCLPSLAMQAKSILCEMCMGMGGVPQPDEASFRSVQLILEACGRWEDVICAYKLRRAMLGQAPPSGMVHEAVGACLKCDQLQAALQILTEAIADGVAVDPATYQLVINVLDIMQLGPVKPQQQPEAPCALPGTIAWAPATSADSAGWAPPACSSAWGPAHSNSASSASAGLVNSNWCCQVAASPSFGMLTPPAAMENLWGLHAG